MKKRRLSIILTLAMCLSLLPTAALAESGPATTSVVAGAFTLTVPVDADANDYYSYENNVLTIKDGAVLTIANTYPDTETSDRIEVEKNADATITLAGVNIDVSNSRYDAALKIGYESSGNVTVVLAEDSKNFLKSGGDCAGLQKDGGTGKLTITGTGSLSAIGSNGIDGESGGAGIGGSYYDSGQNIEIAGGTVTAIGGVGSAGIGGGSGGSAGNITISGGAVTANGGYKGAGIGGGGRGASNITISGGTVTATGGSGGGAGIGGGYSYSGNGITISGGTVTANGGVNAAGIGGGGFTGSGRNIAISGGNVTATGNKGGAGIGGGDDGSSSNITISSGTVTATGGNEGGAGIGGGRNDSGNNIAINGGTVTATGGSGGGAGIGGGSGGSASNITVSGGTVTATATGGTGIGGDVTVSGGNVTATGNESGTGISGSLTLADGSTHVIIVGDTKAVGSATTDTSASGYFRSGTLPSDGDFIGDFIPVQSGGVTMISNDDTEAYFEYVSDSHLAYTNTDGLTHDLGCNDSCSVTKVTVISEEVHDYDATTKRCVCGATKTKIEFSGGITANKSEYFYGDIIQLTVKPVSVGSNTFVSDLDLTLWLGDIQLNVTDKVTENPESQEYIIIYDTSNKGIPVGTDATTLTVKFAETDRMQACEGNVPITLNPKALTVSVTAADRTYEQGNTTVAVTANLDGIEGSDSVALDPASPTGTIPSADAGGYTVTLPTFTLSGDHAEWYTVTQPSGPNVTISKANATDDMKTASGWLVKNDTSTVELPALPSTNMAHNTPAFSDPVASAKVENGALVITGSDEVDEGGRYTVTVPVTGGDNYNNYNITVTLTGSLLPVQSITASDVAATYGDSGVKVTASVTTGNGTLSYAVTEGADIIDVDAAGNITIKKAGTATVTVTAAGTTTYAETTKNVAVTISKATIFVTAKNQNIYVGGTAPDLSAPALNTHYTVTGLASGDMLDGTITMEYQTDGTTATPDTSKTGTYDIAISGAAVPAGGNYNEQITFTPGTLTISTRPSSGGGSSNTTTTEKNEDGSTTTTTTNKTTGTVTETTKYPDGSTTTVETKKDGSATETSKTSDGTTGTVVTDKDGNVTEVSTKVSAAAAKDAQESGEAVKLPVEVEAADDAEEAVEIEVDVPTGGAKVEIPVENVTPATVVVIVNADGTEKVVKTSTVSENGVVVALNQDATVKVIDNSKHFVDVHPMDHWAEEAIDFVVAREIYSGTSATTFHPDNPMARGMLAVVLHNLEDNPDHAFDDLFHDVAEGSWYEDAIHWAADSGIVSGYGNGLYGPNDNITREQLAVMLWRYAGSPDSDHSLNLFTDAHLIADHAKEALAWANENGIINGKGNGILDPKGEATRAQVAQMLMNYLKNVQ